MDEPPRAVIPRAVRGGPAYQVTPTIGVDVLAWSGDKPLERFLSASSYDGKDGAKVVLVEMHPVLPWVLSADKDGEVSLFDYHENQVLMRRTAQDMLRYGGKENVVDSSTVSSSSSSALSAPTAGTHPYTYTAQYSITAATAEGYAPSAFSDQLFSYSHRHPHTPDESAPPPPPPAPPTGAVLQIAFADALAIAHATDTADAAAPTTHNTFNTPGRILVVCEHVVLFYDFEIDSVVSIAASHRKKSPTCAVFACLNTAAMGFADGVIRLWHMQSDGLGRRRKQVKSLATHGAVPIALLKVMVLLRACEAAYPPPQGSPTALLSQQVLPVPADSTGGRRCVRLFSVGGDGSAFLWDLPLDPATHELDLTFLSRYARWAA